MNLLIVDDEIYAIQGILDSIDWNKFTFKEVFTATSSAMATNIFKKHPIDIILCDIEMPYGNGLDLVEWIRKESPSTQCIFLTCHDEFHYAQQAIKLQCLNYILKPVKTHCLIEVLEHAIKVVNENNNKMQYEKYGMTYLEKMKEDPETIRKDILTQVEQHIQLHISDSLTVEGLAKLVYLSPDHLTRLFKKKHGETLIDYITKQRMFLAKELIKQNDLTISRVAEKVGYGNYSYFTKTFKKYYGKPPKAYQKDIESCSLDI